MMSSASPITDTRSALVETATRLFASHGFHGVSVAGLCREAGVANGTFYLYFQNKDEVFAAVVGQVMQALAEQLRSPQREAMDARARDRFDVELMVGFIEARHDLFRILVTEHGLRSEDRDSLIDMFASQRSRELRAGLQRGEFRPGLHPELTAYAEVGITNEVLQRWVRKPRSFSRARLVDELCAMRSLLLFAS
jgi:AcrR family transcriptional regulator